MPRPRPPARARRPSRRDRVPPRGTPARRSARLGRASRVTRRGAVASFCTRRDRPASSSSWASGPPARRDPWRPKRTSQPVANADFDQGDAGAAVLWPDLKCAAWPARTIALIFRPARERTSPMAATREAPAGSSVDDRNTTEGNLSARPTLTIASTIRATFAPRSPATAGRYPHPERVPAVTL